MEVHNRVIGHRVARAEGGFLPSGLVPERPALIAQERLRSPIPGCDCHPTVHTKSPAEHPSVAERALSDRRCIDGHIEGETGMVTPVLGKPLAEELQRALGHTVPRNELAS